MDFWEPFWDLISANPALGLSVAAGLLTAGFIMGRFFHIGTERHLRERLALKDDQLSEIKSKTVLVSEARSSHPPIIKRIEAKNGILHAHQEVAPLIVQYFVRKLISISTPPVEEKFRLLIDKKEKGKNSNGEFTTHGASGTIATASTTIFRKPTPYHWTFPVQYIESPILTIIAPVGAGTITKIDANGLVFERDSQAGADFEVTLIVIGFRGYFEVRE